MSLTIDNGSNVYYLRSSCEIKRVRIESSAGEVTYHAASCADLIRSGTTVSTARPDAYSADILYPIEPYAIEQPQLTATPPGAFEGSVVEEAGRPRHESAHAPSFRQASLDLVRVVGYKASKIAKAGGRTLRKGYKKIQDRRQKSWGGGKI